MGWTSTRGRRWLLWLLKMFWKSVFSSKVPKLLQRRERLCLSHSWRSLMWGFSIGTVSVQSSQLSDVSAFVFTTWCSGGLCVCWSFPLHETRPRYLGGGGGVSPAMAPTHLRTLDARDYCVISASRHRWPESPARGRTRQADRWGLLWAATRDRDHRYTRGAAFTLFGKNKLSAGKQGCSQDLFCTEFSLPERILDQSYVEFDFSIHLYYVLAEQH